jgi:hypothetical protein
VEEVFNHSHDSAGNTGDQGQRGGCRYGENGGVEEHLAGVRGDVVKLSFHFFLRLVGM